MKNILFIHQSAELYGSDKTLLLLLKNLDKTKFSSVVVLPFDGPLKAELEKANIKVIIAPVLKLYRKMFSPKNILKFFKEIKEAFKVVDNLNKEHKFDLIYSNTLAVLLGMIYANRRKIKHIWHVHEIIVHPKIIATIFPKLLNKYTALVICNSNSTKKNLIDRITELDQKTVVIYNGLETGNLRITNSSKEKFGFNSDDIIITLVGRISRLKGHKWLLATFINKLSRNQKVKLLFVGSPVIGQEYYLEEIEQIILENEINDKVKIIPFTKELSQIWSVTDIAIMPSSEAESFGLVAVEAMLAQKPVIGSNHGGLTEIILNNETGFLVEPNNENELAEAISKLVESPELRKLYGENGYQRAIDEFSIERYVQNFEKVLLEQ
ncbi:glycosyltransferase involved in cell wall biosynthesis [Flavobacterium arsenatis]|uniref:Glycosyltransferase involved in cell wall biosynthesis n=1 Tax=Flavobacterium arsenatis TaxID=1484332 RepID=A0ABU1TSA7_9FLAO|nr:glycosyltransferase family 4 protein [Flavobacterium arsenatis]MDR6968744.1 glycosyltransferase involved in cell wall biosynthesis [Flavobacterium arsenatis]